MIGFLRGHVFSKTQGRVMLDVHGVGYELFMPERDIQQLPDAGEEVLVHVYTAFRDNAISLFGFMNEERRRLFLLLLEVSGVGPRLAVNVLSHNSAPDLMGALARGETATLQAIHGIGKKTAARLCVDLKDRAAKLLQESGLTSSVESSSQPAPSDTDSMHADAVSALVNLGWRLPDAERAVALAIEKTPEAEGIQQIITSAMSLLSKPHNHLHQ